MEDVHFAPNLTANIYFFKEKTQAIMKAAAVPIVTIVVYPDISRFCCLLSLLSCLPAAVTLLAPWIRDTKNNPC